MEKKIEIRPEKGVVLRISMPGAVQNIKFADISKYWDFGDEENIGHISCMTRGSLVIMLMLASDRESGVIAGWDIAKEELVHLSEGSYCVSMKLFGKYLYTLCRVENFVVPSHFQVYAVPVGSFDPADAGRRIYCKAPCGSAGMGKNIRLDVGRGGIKVTDGRNSVTYAEDTESPADSPAEGFGYLYSIPMPRPGEQGSERLEGMFT